MESLKKCFISSKSPYKEGDVHVFQQKLIVEDMKNATLHVTALGVYEAQINGVKVGDQLFAPGFTYYHRDLQYQTYDVTQMLKSNENQMTFYLGQGWYCGRFTFDNKTQIYGEQSAISWILAIEHHDGTHTEFNSIDDEVVILNSPFVYAGFYDGEVVHDIDKDEIIGKPIAFTGKIPDLIEPTTTYVKVQEHMPVKKVIQNDQLTILDFGQNFAGFVTIDRQLMDNTSICLRHGEILNPDGTLYTANLRKAKAEIRLTKGNDNTLYTPKFTYMGFRYVEITGCKYVEGLISAYAIYNDMRPTGSFHCDHPMVQKLFENQIWGQKSNYVEVPTDCPQRDERMGYTGDGHVFALTGSYNFNTQTFWKKFLKDIRFSQMDNSEGYIGSTIPASGPGGIGFLNMLGWGNAITIIPNMLFQQFGDFSFIEDQYESMKLFVEAEIRKMNGSDLWLGANLGDWLTLGKDIKWMAMHNNPVSNAFIVNDLSLMMKFSKMMNREEDYKRYAEQYEKTKAAYQKMFITSDGNMTDAYQGAMILALQFVVDEETLRALLIQNLIADIRINGMQTGFFATQHILPLLVDSGYSELAFDLLLQENCPGWIYQIKNGATTTWERWDALRPDGSVNEDVMSEDNMVSFNHYAFGSVGQFYYEYILGIKPLKPGYEKVIIKPFVDSRLGTVNGNYSSVQGEIGVSWRFFDATTVTFEVLTPVESVIELPNGDQYFVDKGSYKYTVKL